MPAVLHVLTDRKELLTNEIYLLSIVTALQRVTETLPHFISPYLHDTTLQVKPVGGVYTCEHLKASEKHFHVPKFDQSCQPADDGMLQQASQAQLLCGF